VRVVAYAGSRKRGTDVTVQAVREDAVHKLMCIVLSAVVIALCRAIRVVCLHDISMIVISVEGADQGEEEPSHHHVAPGMSLPHRPSQQKQITRMGGDPTTGR
jgi:hypothetical protein